MVSTFDLVDWEGAWTGGETSLGTGRLWTVRLLKVPLTLSLQKRRPRSHVKSSLLHTVFKVWTRKCCLATIKCVRRKRRREWRLGSGQVAQHTHVYIYKVFIITGRCASNLFRSARKLSKHFLENSLLFPQRPSALAFFMSYMQSGKGAASVE